MIDYEKLKLAIQLADEAALRVTIQLINSDDGNRFSARIFAALFINDSKSIPFNNIDNLITYLQSIAKPKPKYKIGDEVFMLGKDEIWSFKIDEIINEDGVYWYLNYIDDGDYSDERAHFDQFREDVLYPTCEALIESQISYWQNMRKPNFAKAPYPICTYTSDESICMRNRNHLWVRDKCFDCGTDKSGIQTNKCLHKYSKGICIACGDEDIFGGQCLLDDSQSNQSQVDADRCRHESDSLIYTSFPPQNKCKKCGEFYR